MAQFEVSDRAVRGHIRRLLHDSYRRGFPILKELVQNADDAGARSLAIVEVLDGAGGTGHPLLDGPAILALNDAKFDGRDERGIKSLGDSGKAGDDHKIGRFGLGMKAVFHLCDAFAWLASPRVPNDEPRRVAAANNAELINPWTGVKAREDWTEPTPRQWAAAHSVATRLAAEAFGPESTWFCLWIPRRTPALIGDNHSSFPDGGEQVVGEMLGVAGGRQLAAAMPILRNLRRVRVGRGAAGYELSANSTFGGSEGEARRQLDGRVTLRTGKNERVFRAIGFVARDDALASDFKARKHWPQQENADGHIGPASARASGATYWLASLDDSEDANEGRLRVLPAVHLPLAEDTAGTSDRDVALVLHGEFFIDAGRRGLVLAGSTEQTKIEAEWNRALLDRVLLPELPATVFQLADEAPSPQRRDAVIAAVVKGLRNAVDVDGTGRFFERWRHAIGRDRQLVFRLGMPGGWAIVPASLGVFAIDAPATGPFDSEAALAMSNELLDALPGFDAASKEAAFVPRRSQCLAADEPADLTGEVAERLLGDPAEVAMRFGVDHAAVITGVLRVVAGDPGRTDALLAYTRALIGAWSARPRETRGLEAVVLRAAVDLMPRDRMIRVPDDLPTAVLLHDAGHLLVPDTLAGDASVSGRLDGVAAAALLRRAIDAKTASTLLSRFAQRLVSGVGGDLSPLVDLPIFRATASGKAQQVSLSGLRDAAAAGLLFRGGACVRAVAAAAGATVLDCDDVPAVDGLRDVGSCNEAAACTLLDRLATVSASSPERRPMLELLLRSGINESSRAAIRLLLAGRAVTPDDSLLTSAENAAVWTDLLDAADAAAEQPSVVINASLAALLNSEQCRAFGVAVTDASAVLQRLSRLDDTQLSTLILSPAQADAAYDALLDAVHNSDNGQHDRVARLLPVHPAGKRGRVSIGPNTFVDVGLDLDGVPEVLRRRLQLLSEHPPSKRRRAQKQLVNDLDARALLVALVEHEQRATAVTARADLFLELMKKADGSQPEGLRRLAWLPTPLGLRAPADVLRLPISARRWTNDAEVSEADLSDDLRKRLSLLRPLMPEREASLLRLAEAAATRDELRVGIALNADTINGEMVDTWRTIFAGADGVMPAAGLMREIGEASWPSGVDGGALVRSILDPLATPIADWERLVAIVHHLGRRHEDAAVAERPPIERLIARYLDVATSHEAWTQILPRLRFPSEAGPWAVASSLCIGTPGVSERHLLADWLVPQLKAHVRGTPGEADGEPTTAPATAMAAAPNLSGAAATLRAYVDGLPAPSAVIGAFVMLLGDEPDLRALAEERLGVRTIQATRARIRPWPVDRTSNAVSYRLTLDEASPHVHVAVTVTDAREIDSVNLCGEVKRFPISTRPAIAVARRADALQTDRRAAVRKDVRPLAAQTIGRPTPITSTGDGVAACDGGASHQPRVLAVDRHRPSRSLGRTRRGRAARRRCRRDSNP